MKTERKDIEDIIALTPMQEGMLFHYLEDPESDYYFEQLSLDISGEIDINIFEKAWGLVIETNEILRTMFRWENLENPVQIVLKENKIQPGYYDLSGKEPGEKQKRLKEVMLNDREKKFDLQEVPFRINLCKLEKEKYRLIISNHHILYDGWSNGIILKEFFKTYDDLSKGKNLEKPVKTRFKEFIHRVRNQDIEKQGKYWRSYLEGFDTCTELPIKRKKSAQVNNNKIYRWKWDRVKTNELTNFLKEHKLTFASLLYSAWGILLQGYNNSDDVVFGTTVSGRSAKLTGIEDMVGLFINTLPLRTRHRPYEKAGDLLKRMERELHLRQDYEHSSLVNIRKWSEISKGQKLFDLIIILENYPLENRLITGNKGLSIDTFSIFELTHYDLTVSVSTFAELEVKVIYPGDLFDDESIEKLIHCFASIVETLKENPGQLTAGIEIISNEEKNKILYDFNDTRAEYPAHKTIHQLFAEQVERTPDHTALLGPEHDTRQKDHRSHWSNMSYISITYRHLNQKSHRLADLLKQKSVGADSIVGIMVERSIEMIIGIVGILKAGGAYLPIDPAYPQERIAYMMTDSSACVLLTHKDIVPSLSTLNSTSTCRVSPTNLAYVIYTSGTTGKPKGVVIEHRSLVNRLNWMQKKYPIDNNDTILQKTTFTFDVSVWEILWWAITGAKLCLLFPGGESDPGCITQTVQRNNVTTMHFVPSMLSVFLDYLKSSGSVKKLSCLKQVISSGEALLPAHVEQFNLLLNKENGTKLANLYGPTEATIDVSYFNCPPGEPPGDIVPLGKPIDNIHLYILNNYLKLQPIGVPGELFIAGTGLARGYVNRPELTGEKFCLRRPGGTLFEKTAPPGPPRKNFSLKALKVPGKKDYMQSCNRASLPSPQSPIYHTGDLARWLSDGNIEFLGRIDHQVKIRGFRIELGEIENRLTGHEDIKEAVVVSRQDSQKENQVHAFIVSEKNFSAARLKTYLAGQLPAYMIPAYFKQIEKIPLTSSGKIDRKALISTEAARGLETGAPYAPPSSDVEKIIAEIWKELLGLEKLSVHDNFFDIGGNSLTIIRLNSRLKKAFKKDIPMAAVFTYPTISAMAAHLSGKDKTEPKTRRETGKKGLDIAVIGMSCRFPGAANIFEFWDNVKNGIESIVFFANDELIGLGVETEMMNDRHYVPAKGILKDKQYFDASFFDYTPAEAGIMDPQMRLFHECCWEGLEDAGYDPGTYDGLIGLYAGASSNPLWEILPLSSQSDYSELWGAIQLSDKDYTSTRVGYKLGLKGPCIILQTACSTSLAAVDLACQGLLNLSCDMALAGGVSITMHDEPGYRFREGAIMSRDGHCRPFDARANGTLGGNGAGVVVLKSLENAIRDRDNIYAVIKSSALNNDGKNRVGYTAPGVEGQANVIRTALQKAGVEPDSIGYIEAHGTGTVLGDPIEIEGLKQAFESLQGTSPYGENTCALGSVKANIGHLDAAAGIAGLIKTVLALKHGLIPPSLHFEKINPDIHLENTPFYINTRVSGWKNDKYPRRAGVSSFGIGGTNAHVVLEEWPGDSGSVGQWVSESVRKVPEGTRGLAPLSNRQYQLILLSAKTEIALERMTRSLADYFKSNPQINLDDAAYTLQVGRKSFKYRKMFVCSGIHEAAAALSSSNPGNIRSFVTGVETGPVIFMFPGQGSQYVNMGLELYQKESLFRQELDRCFEILKPTMDYDIKAILYPSIDNRSNRSYMSYKSYKSHIDQTEIAQPLLFAFEYALAKLLIHWGIKPAAMIGHSIGEYTAACLSGVFSLEDAIKLVALRGRLMRRIPAGAMLSVSLGEEELGQLIKDKDISLAAVNAVSSCVVSGTCEAVDSFIKELQARGCSARRLHTSHAFHSRMMEPILKEFASAVRQLPLAEPRTPYISNVTGQWITAGEARDPDYWVNHIRQPVQFAKGITELSKKENPIFVEIGPGNVLSLLYRNFHFAAGGHTRHHPETNDNQHKRFAQHRGSARRAVNLIRHPRERVSDRYYLLKQIGQLWLWGAALDWEAVHGPGSRRRVSLPTYPFEKTPFRVEHLNAAPGIAPVGANPGKLTGSKKADLAEWFYLPGWKRSAPLLSAGSVPLTAQHWWVFTGAGAGPGNTIGTRIIKELEKAGQTVTVIRAGTAFKKEKRGTAGQNYTINPGRYAHYETLVKEEAVQGRKPDRIIHLWGVTGKKPTTPDLGSFDKAQEYGFYSLLYLAKALGNHQVLQDIEISVITDQMQEVTHHELINPMKTTVMGLIRVIPQEYPQVTCRGIDIEAPGPGLIKPLMAEIMETSRDQEIVLRGNYRWTRHYEPVRLEEELENTSIIKEKGVYLILGGFGRVGGILSAYLAGQYKARLVIIGQGETEAVSQRKRKIQELEAMGAQVMAFGADVANRRQMRQVIKQTLQRFGKINGVIFSASIPGDLLYKTVKQLDKPACREQFRAKVYGLLHMQELFKETELDFFMVMSSISAVLGGLGFAAYTAANIFTDSLVQYHNKTTGNPWISVNWDAWQIPGSKETDMLPGVELASLAITPREGTRAIQRVLSLPVVTGPGVQRLVQSAGDIHRRIQQWINPPQETHEQEMITTGPRPGQRQTRRELTGAYKAPADHTEKVLAEIWQAFFGYEQIGVLDNFFELGGDSLKAVNLAARIHNVLNIEIPLAEFFNRPTIETLAQYIMEKAEISPYSSIESLEKKEYYELSSAQKRLFIIRRMNPGNTVYNNPFIFKLEGNLKREKLERVICYLITRHESFRTCFPVIHGQPVQRVNEKVEVKVEVEEEEGEPAADIISSFIRPFDLSQAPLLRIGLIKIETRRHILMLDMHHIISDGTSMNVLANDFMAVYNNEELPALRIQYKDFSGWRSQDIGRESLKMQGEYWQKKLEHDIPVINLPLDYSRPLVWNFEGAGLEFEIPREEVHRLKTLALERETTLYMVLFSLFNIFLSRIANQEVIVVGTAVAGRRHGDLEPIIGMFVNSLTLINYLNSKESFYTFLEQVSTRTLEALENQDYPFEKLVEKFAVDTGTGRNPLFDVMFDMQRVDIDEITMPGLKLKPYKYNTGTSKFDLMLQVEEKKEQLLFFFEYKSKLFKKSTILRFINYFKRIIAAAAANPGVQLSEIEIISETEKKQILVDFNNTASGYPRDKLIHHLFEVEAEKRPDKIAAGYENHVLSYRQLNRQTHKLAVHLKNRGVKPGMPVGIMIGACLEMIVGVIAILKAGGGYLPIDPDYPEERKKYMLKDSGAKILLTSDAINRVPTPQHLFFHPSTLPPFYPSNPSSLAYIIYTSGSTGTPKGVMVEHQNVVRLVKNTNFIKFKPGDRLLQTGALEFDASTFEIWGVLLNGLTLYMLPKDKLLDTASLRNALHGNRITIMWMTAPWFNQVVNSDVEIFSNLQNLLVGGDVLSPTHINQVRKRFPRLNIINGYGPTENTTFSTTFLIDREYKENIPIGKPIANSTAYIMDKNGHLQPIGIVGELWVGGDGISRGYLNNPELTAEKFNHDLWNLQDYHEGGYHRSYMSHMSYITYLSYYQTGDLARWQPDGNIQFLGRQDHQVKIRGFRIEPGEIENQLLSHESIKEALVLAKEDKFGDEYLCAYIIAKRKAQSAAREEISLTIDTMGLRDFLAKQLPAYMIPSYFIQLERIPLTPNGKIDIKSLPKPALETETGRYTAPQEKIEKKLVEIWSEVLALEKEKISIEANFFEMGGHSLKAVMMETKIHKDLGIKPGLDQIFKSPTIKELAAHIKKCAPEKYIDIDAVEEREFYELSYQQKRLWFIWQYDPGSPAYNLTGRIILRHRVDGDHIKKALQRLINRHESLRTLFTTVDDIPVQVVRKQAAAVIKKSDLSSLPGEEKDRRLEEIYAREALTPFNLEKIPLCRAILVKLTETRYCLIFNMHHIIGDGWSMEILKKEFTLIYESYRSGEEFEPGPLKTRYKDFTRWHNNRIANRESKEKSRAYWKKQVKNSIPLLHLPFDFDKKGNERKGAAYTLLLNEEQTVKLGEVARGHNTSLFVLMFSLYIFFLHRFSPGEEVACFIISAGRDHESLHPVMGYFINMVLFKTRLDNKEAFNDFLDRVNREILQGFQHQEYPLELVFKELNMKYPEVPLSFNMLNMGETGQWDNPGPGIQVPFEAKFDLEPYITGYTNAIEIRWAYKEELFKAATIQYMAAEYVKLLDFFLDDFTKSYNDYIDKVHKKKHTFMR